MNMNVSLTAELAEYVKAKVQSGRYVSASEVVREALRLLERQEREDAERLRRLRQAWADGEASGDFKPFDAEAIRAEGLARSSTPRAISNGSACRTPDPPQPASFR